MRHCARSAASCVPPVRETGRVCVCGVCNACVRVWRRLWPSAHAPSPVRETGRVCVCVRLALATPVWCGGSGLWPTRPPRVCRRSSEKQFHIVLYWMLIEVLGRPRIPVTTATGAFVLIVVVAVVFVLIPWQVNPPQRPPQMPDPMRPPLGIVLIPWQARLR